MKNIIIFSLIFCTLLSCKSLDFKNQEIKDVKLHIELDNKLVDYSVIPSKEYKLKLVFTINDNKEIFPSNYKDIELYSSNKNIEIVKMPSFLSQYYTIRISDDTLHLVKNSALELNILVKENIFPKKQISLKIDWNGFSELNYKGPEGLQGHRGSQGQSGYGSSEWTLDGSKGGDGGIGHTGSPGENINIYIGEYDTIDLNNSFLDKKVLLLYNSSKDKLYVSKLHSFTINSSGGLGGKGGQGGLGGNPGTYYKTEWETSRVWNSTTKSWENKPKTVKRAITGKRGNNGKPGIGGNGGNGGDITIFYTNEELLKYIKPISDGGKPGYMGRKPGKAGKISYKLITFNELRKSIGKTSNKSFEIERLVNEK